MFTACDKDSSVLVCVRGFGVLRSTTPATRGSAAWNTARRELNATSSTSRAPFPCAVFAIDLIQNAWAWQEPNQRLLIFKRLRATRNRRG